MPSQIGRWINTVKGWLGMTNPKPTLASGKNASSSSSKPSRGSGMPTGPKGQKRPTTAEQNGRAISRWNNEGGAIPRTKRPKRPADVIGNAIRVAQIAAGEAEEEYEAKPKKNAAAELGRKGGAARAKSMSPERRAEIAKKAAEKHWTQSPSRHSSDQKAK